MKGGQLAENFTLHLVFVELCSHSVLSCVVFVSLTPEIKKTPEHTCCELVTSWLNFWKFSLSQGKAYELFWYVPTQLKHILVVVPVFLHINDLKWLFKILFQLHSPKHMAVCLVLHSPFQRLVMQRCHQYLKYLSRSSRDSSCSLSGSDPKYFR